MTSRLLFSLVVIGAFVVGAYALAGVPPRQIEVVIHEGTNLAAALSPDGETLAIDLLGSIWVIPGSNHVAHRITDELSDARQPDWAPDGEQIAFQAYRDGNWHIWSVGKDGQDLRQHTFGLFDDREPAWSHDGSRIVFSSDRSGNYDIWELNVTSGLIVHETRISANLQVEMPFLATERLMMEAVKQGADRQDAHEVVRAHAIEVARQIKEEGIQNNLLERLSKEPMFKNVELSIATDPSEFIGRSAEQVDSFLTDIVCPIRENYNHQKVEIAELRV